MDSADKEICDVFSANLNRLMARDKINQKELAQRLNVSKSQASLWCLGRNVPRTNYLAALTRLFDCKVSDLLVDKTKSPPPNGDRLDAPPGYDKLSPANKALVDQMIAQLVKGQSDD